MFSPIFFPPFLTTHFSNDDKAFADAICKGIKEALSEFLELYSDELYFIAYKFNNGGFPEEKWEYRTKKGYSIQVSDDVSDCYIWLIKKAKNRSCKYEGFNGATLKTCIMSYLNNNQRKTDWIRHQTKITNYIPKCIKGLSKVHQDVFKMLQQNKQETFIQNKLSLDEIDYYSIYAEVEAALIDAGEIRLLSKPKFISIDNVIANEDENQSNQYESSEFVNPSEIPDFEIVKDMLGTIIETLTEAERRLIVLYWRNGESIDQIFENFSSYFQDYLDELNISSPQDIYPTITKLIKKLTKSMNDLFPELIQDYKLSTRQIRPLIKQYLYDFNDFE